MTALMAAAASCHPGVMRILLDSGAGVHVTDQWGQQAITKAAMYACDEGVALLLKAGADPDGGDSTPLIWCPPRSAPTDSRGLLRPRMHHGIGRAIVKGLKTSVISILAVGLLAGSAVGVAAQDVVEPASASAGSFKDQFSSEYRKLTAVMLPFQPTL